MCKITEKIGQILDKYYPLFYQVGIIYLMYKATQQYTDIILMGDLNKTIGVGFVILTLMYVAVNILKPNVWWNNGEKDYYN